MSLTVPDYSQKPLDELWAEWKVTHKKTYDTPEEEEYRFGIFKETKIFVEEHNAKYLKGEVTSTAGLNQFADRKKEEVCCGGFRRKDNSQK